MKFCSSCGGKLKQEIPYMDNRLRHVCCECDAIHYENPKIIVGSLPIWEDKVLLCRRAIEPRLGYWTLPAGFLENQETSLQGAKRETLEEAGALIEESVLYRLFDIASINQVYIFYLGYMASAAFAKGEESIEVALFEEKDIPWDDLAFPVMKDILREYFQDRTSGIFPVRYGEPSSLLARIT